MPWWRKRSHKGREKIKTFCLILLCLFCLCSCDNLTFTFTYGSGFPEEETDSDYEIYSDIKPDSIENIKKRVVYFANEYKKADTEYGWGCQDPLRAIRIDCSGLVIRCYTYALQGSDYTLLQNDMNSEYLYKTATIKISETNLEPGDLVFMGDKNSKTVNHVGIFTKKVGNKIYFIDSTSTTNPSGVSERSYDKSNSIIKGYGEMRLNRK